MYSSKARLLIAFLVAAACFPQVPPEIKPALERISADALKADVSFLASDLLQGRMTPSPGLDIAAEYIAAQFRRAGLEPAGDDGYFQTAKMNEAEADLSGFRFEAGGVSLKPDDVALINYGAVDLTGVEAVRLDAADRKGKVVFATPVDLRRNGFWRELRGSGAALLVVTGSRRRTRERLVEAGSAGTTAVAGPQGGDGVPTVFVRSSAIATAALAQGARVTVHAAAPKTRPVTLRNVAAIIRGSDPQLKDTFVMLTAHYDHIGTLAGGQGDRINNGANDDASGTASLIAVASALAKNEAKPKRSVLFVAFFGEEEGGIGSGYYGRHPIVPLAKTVANLNLEHMGRTDDSTGPKINDATITGFQFSSVPAAFVKAGEMTGIRVYNDEKRGDPFFARSDNQILADKGIPAHSMCVAFEFPDYHNVGDEWQKLDYENMARVDRMVATGVWLLANDPAAPEWNAQSAAAARYIKAAEALHAPAASR